jgi:hypothetical protein
VPDGESALDRRPSGSAPPGRHRPEAGSERLRSRRSHRNLPCKQVLLSPSGEAGGHQYRRSNPWELTDVKLCEFWLQPMLIWRCHQNNRQRNPCQIDAPWVFQAPGSFRRIPSDCLGLKALVVISQPSATWSAPQLRLIAISSANQQLPESPPILPGRRSAGILRSRRMCRHDCADVIRQDPTSTSKEARSRAHTL